MPAYIVTNVCMSRQYIPIGVKRLGPGDSCNLSPTQFLRLKERLKWLIMGNSRILKVKVVYKDDEGQIFGMHTGFMRPDWKSGPIGGTTPEVLPEKTPEEPEDLNDGAGGGDGDERPSLYEINDATKKQILEWCGAFGVSVDSGDRKSAVKSALIDQIYPEG